MSTLGFSQQLKNGNDTLSYALGIIVAQNLQHQGITDLNSEVFTQGLSQIVNGDETVMDVATAQGYLMEFQQKQQESASMEQKTAGIEFLKANKMRPEVKSTESGLQYEVLQAGDGPRPKADDEVEVHYHGTLIDGTVFDSSVERGEPAQFPLNRVIKGWTEVLQLMPVGSKWRVYIPYDLAYGERGAGPDIKPYSTLIFDIELLNIM